MTDDLSALREEVARAAAARAGIENWDAAGDNFKGLCYDHGDDLLGVSFSDPVRLVRVLTDQPCTAGCVNGLVRAFEDSDFPSRMGGNGETITCGACKANPGRLDLVGLLVENGTLEAVEQRPWGFDPTIHNPGAAAFRRSSKEGSA